MPRKVRKKGVTPLQIMQFVGPQGLMRRIDVAELTRAPKPSERRESPQVPRTDGRPTPSR